MEKLGAGAMHRSTRRSFSSYRLPLPARCKDDCCTMLSVDARATSHALSTTH
ncbi:hypothetical protein [Paenibacillus lactis]|uniref:hypothetical protein n=1 Tax=Paenibacillus lactis TaxID=228574 RepID=UPI001643B3B8